MASGGLIKPLRFRFGAPEDIERYGDRWWVYDESVWTQMPARKLMVLEIQIGAPLVDVMAGVRASSAFGDMAAAWLAMTMDPETLAPAYASFNPKTMLMEWDSVPEPETEPEPEVDGPKEEGPEIQTNLTPVNWLDSGPDRGPDGSGPHPMPMTDTVSLPSMPLAGSNGSYTS